MKWRELKQHLSFFATDNLDHAVERCHRQPITSRVPSDSANPVSMVLFGEDSFPIFGIQYFQVTAFGADCYSTPFRVPSHRNNSTGTTIGIPAGEVLEQPNFLF